MQNRFFSSTQGGALKVLGGRGNQPVEEEKTGDRSTTTGTDRKRSGNRQARDSLQEDT